MFQGGALFERLHQATRLPHHRLERRVDIYRPNFDVHNYRRLLQDFWGFYRPLERKLVVLADHILPSAYSRQRLKAPRLEQDLLSLGMTKTDIAALPLCGRLPALPTLPQAFGVLYVIEEAAVGGRMVALHMHEKLGIDPSQGGSFFSSYDSQVGPYWQELEKAMTAMVEEPNLQVLAVKAAVDTLDCFEAWLDYRHRPQRPNCFRWNTQCGPNLLRDSYLGAVSGAA